jgi:hypothetical protein
MAFALTRRRRRDPADGRPVADRPVDSADDRPRDPANGRPPVTARATGAAAGAAGAGMLLIARIIRAITSGVVLIIVAAILFKVLGANPSNGIVSNVTDWARWLVGPFNDLFKFDNAKTAVAVNWGLGAFVYLLIGSFIARLFARGAFAGFRARDRRTAY